MIFGYTCTQTIKHALEKNHMYESNTVTTKYCGNCEWAKVEVLKINCASLPRKPNRIDM